MAQDPAIRSMNGGDGCHSYSRNSSYQRKAIEAAKELINKSIMEKFDIQKFSSLKTYSIADMGCSDGPNTLLAVQNIIDAVKAKLQSNEKASNDLPEFHIFFNDQVVNDFNHLFLSLPPEKGYFAAGVPGSFYSRLFPSDSLHFVHSSYASQWLSRMPSEVFNCSPMSRRKVHYSNSAIDVIKAFEDQFASDLGIFLELRAHEIVQGGFLAIIVPGRQNRTPHSKVFINHVFEQLGSVLEDMANERKIANGKIDSFMMAQYFASLEEVELVVRRNKCFGIEVMENMAHEIPPPSVMSCTLRAIMEVIIKGHFGKEISDEVFDVRLLKKLAESASTAESLELFSLFVLLKRR